MNIQKIKIKGKKERGWELVVNKKKGLPLTFSCATKSDFLLIKSVKNENNAKSFINNK